MNNLLKIIISTLFIFQIVTINAQDNETVFKVGEKLGFKAYYGPITGAKAVMVLNTAKYGGKELYHAKVTGYTVGLTDKLYKIYEVYQSYFSKESYLPAKASEDVNEGEKYKRNYVYYFNHRDNSVWSITSGNHKIPNNTYDVISAFYMLRNMDLSNIKINDVIRIQTFFQDEPWELIIKFKGYDEVDLNLGKIKCMKFIPIVQEKGVFKDEESLSIWISADKNRIPIRAQMDLMVGAFKIDLISHEGLKYNLNFK